MGGAKAGGRSQIRELQVFSFSKQAEKQSFNTPGAAAPWWWAAEAPPPPEVLRGGWATF